MTEADEATAKRRGPAPRGPFIGKRKTLTTRITEGVREQLEDAAKASDRSLSQEIEFRLERSFLTDEARRDRDETAYGGTYTHALLRLFADTIKDLEKWTGGTWVDDQYTFDQVRLGITTFLDALKPTGSSDNNPRLVDRLIDAALLDKLPPAMAAEIKDQRNEIGATVALSHLNQLKVTAKRGKPQDGPVRADGLQLAYDTAPIIAPLIGRDED